MFEIGIYDSRFRFDDVADNRDSALLNGETCVRWYSPAGTGKETGKPVSGY